MSENISGMIQETQLPGALEQKLGDFRTLSRVEPTSSFAAALCSSERKDKMEAPTGSLCWASLCGTSIGQGFLRPLWLWASLSVTVCVWAQISQPMGRARSTTTNCVSSSERTGCSPLSIRSPLVSQRCSSKCSSQDIQLDPGWDRRGHTVQGQAFMTSGTSCHFWGTSSRS